MKTLEGKNTQETRKRSWSSNRVKFRYGPTYGPPEPEHGDASPRKRSGGET